MPGRRDPPPGPTASSTPMPGADAPARTGPVDLPAVVATYFALLNADRLDGFANLWHEDPTLSVFGRRGRRTLRGRDDVLGWYDHLFRPWSHHHDRVVRTAVAGDVVTVAIEFTGATSDGRPVAFEALDVFELADDRIRHLAIWHDVLAARDALAPPDAAPPGAATSPPVHPSPPPAVHAIAPTPADTSLPTSDAPTDTRP